MPKRFGMTGAAGYIAPRHMEAIKLNDGSLDVILDPNDSVGHIDSFFPEALYFNNFERFERHIYKIQSSNKALDFLSICAPNYLHDTHCRFALNHNMDAICEKPLVLNPWNLDVLQKAEQETGQLIFNILQLRLHPEIVKLKEWVDSRGDTVHQVKLNYITSRGPWYQVSWKGREEMSGGIASNIGIHFFDMLMWVFGGVEKSAVLFKSGKAAAGQLLLNKANVNWFLSVNAAHLDLLGIKNMRTYRSLEINNKAYEFSQGFEKLHTASYSKILDGQGFGTEDVRNSIELAYNIRNAKPELDHPEIRSLKQLFNHTKS